MDLSCLCCSHVKIFIGDGPTRSAEKAALRRFCETSVYRPARSIRCMWRKPLQNLHFQLLVRRDVNPIGSPPTSRRLFMEPSGTAKKKYQELESQGGLFFVRSWLQTTRGGR